MSLYETDLGKYEKDRIADLERAASRGTLAPWARDIAFLIEVYRRQIDMLLVRGVTCETCDGSGIDPAFRIANPPCPANCINGLVPSPEAIEAGAEAWVMADVTYAKPSSIPWSETNAGLKRQYRARTTEALMAAVDTEET